MLGETLKCFIKILLYIKSPVFCRVGKRKGEAAIVWASMKREQAEADYFARKPLNFRI